MSGLLPYLFLFCCIHLGIANFFSLCFQHKNLLACVAHGHYCHGVNFYLEFLHKVWDPFSFAFLVLLWQNSLFIAIAAVRIQNSLLKDLLNSPDILYALVLNIVKSVQSIYWNYLVSFSTFRQSQSIDLDFSSRMTAELSFFFQTYFLLWWSLLYELVRVVSNHSLTSNPFCSSLWKNQKEKVIIS